MADQKIIQSDCLDGLRTLADGSVHCCVTSPPYWGLRDYGHDGQIGLESTTEEYVSRLVEVFREVRRVLRDDGTLWLNLGDTYGSGKQLEGIPWRVAFALQQPLTDWQIKTEAMRAWTAGIVDGEGCITILQTKSSHSESLSYPPIVQVRMSDREALDRLVAVVGSQVGKAQLPPSHLRANQRESWQWRVSSNQASRVIAEIYPYLTVKRRQAIVAWNHQNFRSTRGNGPRTKADQEKEEFCKRLINSLNQREAVDLPSWMKEPHVVTEPSWYLRQDCIWHKPNPMPESVRDRCTKAHEYVFLLAKSERYFYDAEAVSEPSVTAADGRGSTAERKASGHPARYGDTAGKASRGEGWSMPSLSPKASGRNRRSVWKIATKSYRGAHFATMPPELAETCLRAGTSESGCCSKCGTPRERVVDRKRVATRPGADTKVTGDKMTDGNRDPQRHVTTTTTTGWRSPCGHDSPAEPCTVLDPFGGSGTTLAVAAELGLNAIGFELNADYICLAEERIAKSRGKSPLFASLSIGPPCPRGAAFIGPIGRQAEGGE